MLNDLYGKKEDVELLEGLYAGRKPFHGELHDHARTGGTSDGQCTLPEWKAMLEDKKMDFASYIRQSRVE